LIILINYDKVHGVKFLRIGLLLLSALIPALASAWDLNDVTILYPLPSPQEQDSSFMISPVDPESGAVHLDTSNDALFAAGYIYANTETLGLEFITRQLRVVGVRIDPCFRDQFIDECKRQIRFSWQPVVLFKDHWVTLDSAVHTFYTLNENEWSSLIGELQNLEAPYSALTRAQPLQPHPALVKEGLAGSFAKGLRKILSKYATTSHITRAASTKVNGVAHDNGDPGDLWDFAMGELNAQGMLTQAFIPNVLHGVAGENPVFETVGNSSQDGMDFQPYHNPATEGPSTTSPLKKGTENILKLFMGPISSRDAAHLYRSALRLQQPGIHLPGTTDCVSCHASTSAKVVLGQQLDENTRNKIDKSILSQWSGSRFNLENTSVKQGDTRIMRALGYAGTDPAISWRVIYESAHAADQMNQ
jgi:hypothetical protein